LPVLRGRPQLPNRVVSAWSNIHISMVNEL
jgi:hypothetical protein